MFDFAVMEHDTAIHSTATFSKTRIAPTPSGYLHLGNVLSFALTAALAERHKARILLRIDDMDRERFDRKYVQDIFDTLRFLEIPWHEGPKDERSFTNEYSQLHRLELYRELLQELEAQQAVFACDCSRSLLLKNNKEGHYKGACSIKGSALDAKGVCWRLHTDDRIVSVNTLPGTLHQALPPSVHYFIVKKKDGYPAYQLSSLADDLHFGVDLIVRGEDLRPSTLAQCYLAHQLKQDTFLRSTFFHHPLIKDSYGEKLSKSAGAASIHQLRKEGKKPSDIYTLIGRMAGIPGTIKDWRMLAREYLYAQRL